MAGAITLFTIGIVAVLITAYVIAADKWGK